MDLTSEMSIKDLLLKRSSTTYLNCEGLWYDWFCKDSSLNNKGKYLLTKLSRICKYNDGKKFNPEKCYVFFKNNCPMGGHLYDDFRICDLETKKVLYTIVPKSGFYANEGVSELWGKDNGFEEPLVEGKWQEVLDFFKGK